jgi:very-long-chain enoyl-CoA reductase
VKTVYRFWGRFAVWLWQAHFIKRELETLFVHKFSRPSMPLFNLFKNSWYYWTFATLVSYPLCNPNYLPPSQTCVTAGAVLMLVSEVVNFAVHFQLSNMRSTVSDQSLGVLACSAALWMLYCNSRARIPAVYQGARCFPWFPVQITPQKR